MQNRRGNSNGNGNGDGGTVSPAIFEVGSLESRAAARAMLEARKTGKEAPATSEESFPGCVTFNFAVAMAGPDGVLRYKKFIEQITADDVEELNEKLAGWLKGRAAANDSYPFPLKLHGGQILERIRPTTISGTIWIGDWGGMVGDKWMGDYDKCIGSGMSGPEAIVLRDADGVWRAANHHGTRSAQRLWHDIEVYAAGWAGAFPEGECKPRFLTIRVEMEGHRLIPMKRAAAS
jgi:hypothetical protein